MIVTKTYGCPLVGYYYSSWTMKKKKWKLSNNVRPNTLAKIIKWPHDSESSPPRRIDKFQAIRLHGLSCFVWIMDLAEGKEKMK